MNTLEFPLPENTQLPRPPQRGSSAHTRATLDAIPLRISCYPQVVMSPTNPDKPPLIVFRGDADKWSDARNTIELYLRALDPPLIGYVRVSDYDGTQTFPLEDGTVHPLIREPQTPAAPPSTTGSAGGDGLDDDPDMSESERKRRKKERKKARQLALDPIGVSLTVSREMSKVSFIIQQCMDENIRLLIYGKKPYDAWKLLNDRYGTAEAVDHMRLLRELNALKLKVGDDPGIFVATSRLHATSRLQA